MLSILYDAPSVYYFINMVDPVITEQNTIDVENKPDVKSNRRRNVRRTRNPKDLADKTNISESEEPKRREQRKRAPRVRTEGENVVREKADFTDGILRLKISSSRPRTIYTRLVRLMLAGYDGMGNPLETTVPISRIEVSALGNAIGSAIFVADNLVKANVCKQVSMSADFVNVDAEESVEEGKISRGAPRMLISLEKLDSWDFNTDDVLQKTRVFRSKVLGLPEDA